MLIRSARNICILPLVLCLVTFRVGGQTTSDIFVVKSGNIFFHSNAKLELIKAESTKLRGAIDAVKRTFAFAIDINSFEGFNSPLQKEHFNENYMETTRFPTATFSGRIVEDDDFTRDGTYNIRAKGKFTIHGVEQERIIQGDLQVKNGVIKLRCFFTVFLSEHEIKIPKIVYEKLASEITVDINAEFVRK